jgi:DNA-directed RNA polymerase subunit RPC12/RpoP
MSVRGISVPPSANDMEAAKDFMTRVDDGIECPRCHSDDAGKLFVPDTWYCCHTCGTSWRTYIEWREQLWLNNGTGSTSA